MIFKLYDCDVGIKINGVNYDFEHVQSVTVEDPEFTRLTRGVNAKNKTGLVYKEGLREPKRVTIPILNMSIELKAALDAAYADDTRMDVYAISRTDGSSKMARNAILSQAPQQLVLDETPDSLQVNLSWETFDMSEVHKT